MKALKGKNVVTRAVLLVLALLVTAVPRVAAAQSPAVPYPDSLRSEWSVEPARNKMRLTAEGRIRPCLGNHLEIDLKPGLRPAVSEERLRDGFLEATKLSGGA